MPRKEKPGLGRGIMEGWDTDAQYRILFRIKPYHFQLHDFSLAPHGASYLQEVHQTSYLLFTDDMVEIKESPEDY